MPDIDQDLDTLDRDQLVNEVKRLRQAVRSHRDNIGHALCWYQPEMWGLLPEKVSPSLRVVPPWPEFMAGCIEYRKSLDENLHETSSSGRRETEHLIARLIALPPGFIVELFGDMATVGRLESGQYSVTHQNEEKNLVEWFHDAPAAAAHSFLSLRERLRLGYDFETEQPAIIE